MDVLFLNGEDCHVGDKLVAAWENRYPTYSRNGACRLPRVKQALKGWKKAAPGGSCLPLPFLVAVGMAIAMAWAGAKDCALQLLVSFVCYLRPVESMSIHPEDIVVPAGG